MRTLEAAGVVEYLEYLGSGKRVLWLNFKAGVAKGLGITLGMSVVVGLVVWGLTMLVDLPLVGEYARDAVGWVKEYQESTNYNEEFQEMNALLRDIRDGGDAAPEAADLAEASPAQEDPGPEIPAPEDSIQENLAGQ
jgi:hypothetical protein